jgi:uncharacterized protein
MDFSIVVMVVIVAVLIAVAYLVQGWTMVFDGLRLSGQMLETVWLRMILGLLMAGMVQVVIPAEAIGHLMGEGAGLRGILVGTLAGSITPGGPFVNFPIVAALRGSGAGFGPLAAYLTAWGLIPVHRTLIWEFSFMGPKFVFARLLASLVVPILIGLATPAIMETVFRLSKTKIAG